MKKKDESFFFFMQYSLITIISLVTLIFIINIASMKEMPSLLKQIVISVQSFIFIFYVSVFVSYISIINFPFKKLITNTR